jgi:hypothetical protein
MKRLLLIPGLTLAVAIALPAVAAPSRAAITTTQIAAAISDAGMKISAEQVTLLTDVLATTSSPTLTVQSMEPWGDHRMKVRMDCAGSEECLPFFVAVRFDSENTTQPSGEASDRSSIANLQSKLAVNSIVVRAGSPATLLLDGGHVHIRLSVVCLENGMPGQTIRVSSKDRRQTYSAEVVNKEVLRGSL